VSHYRVIEVDGDRVSYVYPSDTDDAPVDHSIPVGRLRVFDEPAPAGQVAVSVQNALNQGFAGAHVWLTVPKQGDAQPAVTGGRLVQSIPTGDDWLCEGAVDLPEKGGVKVVASADGQAIAPIPVEASYEGPAELAFALKTTPEGTTYYEGPQDVTIELKNTTDQPLRTVPVLRLNGNLLSIAVEGQEGWPVSVPPSGAVKLEPRMLLSRLSPGRHTLQLMFLEDPVRRVTTFPVTLKATQ